MKMRRAAQRIAAASLALAVMSSSGGPALADTDTQAARFLVAVRDLPDPNFAKSVVLIIRHDKDGAMGIIVNRPTRVTPREVMPDIDQLADYGGPVFFGGPLMLDRMMVLFRSDTAPDTGDAIAVTGDVYISASEKALLALPANDFATERMRIFAGHAGWAPGQLDREIAAGGWHVVPAQIDLLFKTPEGPDWQRLLPDARPLSVDAAGSADPGPAVIYARR
ncbi:MAG: YqgE/AlgH family protein [Gammaproteobacteria bacterium]